MGAAYSVFMKITPKQGHTETEIAGVLENFINTRNGKSAFFREECVEKLNGTLEAAINTVLPGVEVYGDEWEAEFDASYSWGVVICEMLEEIAPFLAPGSEIRICPDSDCSLGIVKEDGTVKWSHTSY